MVNIFVVFIYNGEAALSVSYHISSTARLQIHLFFEFSKSTNYSADFINLLNERVRLEVVDDVSVYFYMLTEYFALKTT